LTAGRSSDEGSCNGSRVEICDGVPSSICDLQGRLDLKRDPRKKMAEVGNIGERVRTTSCDCELIRICERKWNAIVVDGNKFDRIHSCALELEILEKKVRSDGKVKKVTSKVATPLSKLARALSRIASIPQLVRLQVPTHKVS
jgi:hypothetical protein